jgi:hypothetical protein
MRLSTALALVFAIANAFALLTVADVVTTDLSATPVTLTSTWTPTVDSSPIVHTSTETVTATPTESLTSPTDDATINGMNACHPQDNIVALYFNAPCNQLGAIEAQCAWGPRALELISLPQDSNDKWPESHNPEWQEMTPEAQRTCFCQSQITDATVGCAACLNAHGVPMLAGLYETLYSYTMLEQYCEISHTITKTFPEFSSEAYENCDSDEDESSESVDDEKFNSSSTEEYLGTSTDVSLYYAMLVTRSDAYDVAVPTPASGGDVTYTTTRISDGQIVPTAQAEKEAGEQDPAEAGTPSISTSSTSSFGDSFTKNSASSVSRICSLGIATPSTSQSSSDDERDSVQALEGCYPSNATGHLDFNAPCNQAQAILAQCAYGPNALQILTFPFDSGGYPAFSPNVQKLSPATERTCICQSQLTDVTIGCLRCNVAHYLLHQSKNS